MKEIRSGIAFKHATSFRDGTEDLSVGWSNKIISNRDKGCTDTRLLVLSTFCARRKCFVLKHMAGYQKKTFNSTAYIELADWASIFYPSFRHLWPITTFWLYQNQANLNVERFHKNEKKSQRWKNLAILVQISKNEFCIQLLLFFIKSCKLKWVQLTTYWYKVTEQMQNWSCDWHLSNSRPEGKMWPTGVSRLTCT